MERKETIRSAYWFVRHIYEKTGFFTPPYETTASLKKRLKKRMKVPVHSQAHLHLVQAATLFLIRSLFKDFPVSHHRHAHSDHRIKREIFIHDQDIRITFFLHSTLFRI